MDLNEDYSYQYSFSVKDEIVTRYNHIVVHKIFVFEIETAFIIKKRDGEEVEIGSETFDSVINGEYGEVEGFDSLHWGTYDKFLDRQSTMTHLADMQMGYRLKDYLMPENYVYKFINDAIDFATQIEAYPAYASQLVVPINVKFKVVTLQKGETIEAVGPDVLVPIHVCPFSSHAKEPTFDFYRSFFLLDMPRVRVEDVDMIRICGICSRVPNSATRITTLPDCGHSFHSHCIIGWLWENDTCPSCKSVAYNASQWDDPMDDTVACHASSFRRLSIG